MTEEKKNLIIGLAMMEEANETQDTNYKDSNSNINIIPLIPIAILLICALGWLIMFIEVSFILAFVFGIPFIICFKIKDAKNLVMKVKNKEYIKIKQVDYLYSVILSIPSIIFIICCVILFFDLTNSTHDKGALFVFEIAILFLLFLVEKVLKLKYEFINENKTQESQLVKNR